MVVYCGERGLCLVARQPDGGELQGGFRAVDTRKQAENNRGNALGLFTRMFGFGLSLSLYTCIYIYIF